jgi:uncharacterized protein YyaL (SSP411 family)
MTNRLAVETSPYLRQHAHNPVDWWPWCDEALAVARTRGAPILLSIGYSACHWCHVMAHESFEDADTARVMNELFVNIKVDREERPDLDKIYQLAHQALTRRGGGWPLTVFLTPDDHLPFFAGTYFPQQPRHGMPPFTYVLQQVRSFWDQQREQVREQNALLRDFLRDYGREDASAAQLTDAPIHAALVQIQRSFDARFGGHLGAPKFPHCPEMELLLDLPSDSSLKNGAGTWSAKGMVELTLQKMAEGGIHDQIGGGFCRYSVDERWEIPHFEKMLYDNAQLLPLYARVGSPASRRVAHELCAWLLREMTDPNGGFYSALDADSEHAEGKFYVWQREKIRAELDSDELAVAERYYGFDRPPNFEQHAWNPIVAASVDDVATRLEIGTSEAETRLARAREKLFAVRSQRVRPGLDDKILTAWNALMISGIARAARSLDAAPLLGLADAAVDFLYKAAWRNERLLAKAGADASRFPAYLDDYAFLLDALLEVLQSRWSERDLAWAIVLAEGLLQRFEDRERGGFFFTAHDHETLIQRPKPWADEAVPSGNGVAARALLRLGHLLGETRYLDAAERALRAAWPTLQQMPQACATLLRALNDFLNASTHVVIRYGNADEEQAWRAALVAAASNRTDGYLIPASAATLPGTLAAQKYTSGGVAYVCRATQCAPPIASTSLLASSLKNAG